MIITSLQSMKAFILRGENMNNDVLVEIKNLNDSDLLALYDEVNAHLQYLKESIILEEKEVSDDTSENQEDGGEAKDE